MLLKLRCLFKYKQQKPAEFEIQVLLKCSRILVFWLGDLLFLNKPAEIKCHCYSLKKLIITEQEETKFYVMFHELNSPTFENIQLSLEYYIVNHSAILL